MKRHNLAKYLLAGLLAVAMCLALVACGSGDGSNPSAGGSNPSTGGSQNQSDAGTGTGGEDSTPTGGTFTATTDNFESWDYSFTNINAFGDEAGVGMLNIQSWGNKKLALGGDGTCDGEGCTWTIQLDVDGDKYTLSTIAHIKGAGDVYSGEGDFTYKFMGSCSAVDGGFKLAAPEMVEVSLTGDFTRLSDGSDFADYIPSAPVSLTSNDADDCDAAAAFKNKIVPSYLVSTVFGGATFQVSGSEIVSVTDIDFPVV